MMMWMLCVKVGGSGRSLINSLACLRKTCLADLQSCGSRLELCEDGGLADFG